MISQRGTVFSPRSRLCRALPTPPQDSAPALKYNDIDVYG